MLLLPLDKSHDIAHQGAERYHRSFNRFELKYRLHYEQVKAFLGRIAEYVRPDPHNEALGFYPIVSLYYDSPDLVCFREKMNGLKFRRKVRIRLYNEDHNQAFLEIKQRVDRTIQKRRARGPLGQIMSHLDLTEGRMDASSDDEVYGEAFFLVHERRLEPKIIVSYNREAYFGIYEPGLRITVDKYLRYGKYIGDFDFSFCGGAFFLPHYDVILEVKFNDAIPLWLCNALNSFNFQQTRISKYSKAVSCAFFKCSY